MALVQVDLESVEQLRGRTGIRRIRQTFPNDEDDDLRTLFVADVDAQHINDVLEFLRAQPFVIRAEPLAPRKLV